MNNREITEYELMTLAQYSPEDLDHPIMEVAYETPQGADAFQTVCLVDMAERAHKEFVKLQEDVKRFQAYFVDRNIADFVECYKKSMENEQ